MQIASQSLLPSFRRPMAGRTATLEANIEAMCGRKHGYDVVIVCCSSKKQADYWQRRLTSVRGQVIPAGSLVLAVFEDWAGEGAGNGLGTLYAYQNARQKAQTLYGVDLHMQLQAHEISIALYHTAGKGTRLAPLPGAENNNKPGVKLPTTLRVEEKQSAMTILEAVLKQTGIYAPKRKGRLSVFWGDQVFVPTVPVVEYQPSHHVDILCSLGPLPSAEDWQRNGLEKYGLIAVNEQNEAAQIEKVDHATALALLSTFGSVTQVGVSLGSFSLSAAMLIALLDEFDEELQQKQVKLDTDPGLWMPLSLTKEAYIRLLAAKKVSEGDSSQHYDRIRNMLHRFQSSKGHTDLSLLGPVNIGKGAYWWDYGQLKLYSENSMRVTGVDEESCLYRRFLGIPPSLRSDCRLSETKVDEFSVLSAVYIEDGSVKESVLTDVSTLHAEVEGAVLVNVTAKRVRAGRGAIIYNVLDQTEEGLEVGPREVLVGVFDTHGNQQRMHSSFDKDGGVWWKRQITAEQPTFESIYLANREADVAVIEAKAQAAHSRAREGLKAVAAYL